ncbi:MAG: hypothetical protein ACI4UX_02960 [Clostridia bacterium]
MFRRWLSEFIRNNKEKTKKIIKLFGLLLLVGIGAMIAFRTGNNSVKESSKNTIYNPTKTIISGENVKKEDFKQEENLINSFVEYCNSNKIQEAYNLLTDECKLKMYPSLEIFKKNYYDVIFNEKKECTLQSWITNKNYNTYKVTLIEDIMATGNYDNVKKIIDYITIETENGKKKLNINNYIKSEEINKTTKTEELEILVESVDVYMDSVKYYLLVSNLSGKDILLDTLKNDLNVKFIGSNGVEYGLDGTNLFSLDLLIYGTSKNKKIELKFNKQYGSEVEGESIEFKNAIMNCEEYLKDENSYNGYKKISIKLY